MLSPLTQLISSVSTCHDRLWWCQAWRRAPPSLASGSSPRGCRRSFGNVNLQETFYSTSSEEVGNLSNLHCRRIVGHAVVLALSNGIMLSNICVD